MCPGANYPHTRMLPTNDGADRGQLLVIIGLLLGLAFVALALVLNAAIFTENFATREVTDSERSTAYTSGMEAAIEGAYDRTNDNATRKAVHATATFDESLRTWVDSQADAAAERGAVFEADWTTHDGWRLRQDADGSFAPDDDADATDWTVADDAHNVSAFELSVTRDDLYEGADTAAFHVYVSDGTTDWELYIHQSGSDIVVSQGDPATASEQCARTTARAVVDLRNHTFDGTNCDALEIPGTIEGPVEIGYGNVQSSAGDERVVGTYTLVVNGTGAIETNGSNYPERFNVAGKVPPTATAIVYAVEYDTHYERDDIVYDREGRYAPREEAR